MVVLSLDREYQRSDALADTLQPTQVRVEQIFKREQQQHAWQTSDTDTQRTDNKKIASTRQLNDADTYRANTQTNDTLHIRQLLLGQQLPGSIVIARHTSLAEPPVDVVYEGTHKVIREILLQPGKDRVEAQAEEEGACRVTC